MPFSGSAAKAWSEHHGCRAAMSRKRGPNQGWRRASDDPRHPLAAARGERRMRAWPVRTRPRLRGPCARPPARSQGRGPQAGPGSSRDRAPPGRSPRAARPVAPGWRRAGVARPGMLAPGRRIGRTERNGRDSVSCHPCAERGAARPSGRLRWRRTVVPRKGFSGRGASDRRQERRLRMRGRRGPRKGRR